MEEERGGGRGSIRLGGKRLGGWRGLEGPVGDWRPDLVNKIAENNSLDSNMQRKLSGPLNRDLRQYSCDAPL